MYSLMDSDYRFSFLYSICALIVLNFWVINLLVAVVVNTFQSIRAETKKSAFGGELIAKAKRQGGFGSPVIMTRGENRAKKMYEKTQLFWVLLVLVNVVALGAKSHKSSQRFIDVTGECRPKKSGGVDGSDNFYFRKVISIWDVPLPLG
jgi:voltage-dependent calcium channel